MRTTEWLSIDGLVLAGDTPPGAGSVVIDLTGPGSNPKFGVVISTPRTPAIIQLNDWWQDTKPLHVHPWTSDEAHILLTGLVGRMEVSSVQSAADVPEGHGVLTMGTGGVRLHCSNILAKGLGSRMIVNPHTWAMGAGIDSPQHGTRKWRIVTDTPNGVVVLCDGAAFAPPPPKVA